MAVESALLQTRPPTRVVVIADGCTDGTQDAVHALRDERAMVLDLPKGPGYGYANRNEVLRIAGEGVVAWLGDDDLYLPDHLERVGELFDAGVADIVSTLAVFVDVESKLTPRGMDWRIPAFRRQFMRGHNRTPMGAVSHRAEPARSLGGWREEVPIRGDRDLWQRLLESGARPSMVAAPTVLHFRATGRDQPWADRVAQNAAFLERIRDPAKLAELRSQLALAVHFEQRRMMSLLRRASWWVRTGLTP